jgi:D-alanyl-D-alanine carboxypeptidase/D-alanyl-D-alanine-endopeptidase (penicillin-binding protein 4)
MGGTLEGSVREGQAPLTPPTFVFESPPLAQVIRDIDKFSNNVMAQLLFLTVGLEKESAGTPDAARHALAQFVLERTGCRSQAWVIDNGSGLSQASRSSAACLSRLLQDAWNSPVMPEMMSALPIAGVDGTTKRRVGFGAATGQAHLKTGTLDNSVGLAGWVLGRSGKRYVFVAMINHPHAAAARPALEALAHWTAAD